MARSTTLGLWLAGAGGVLLASCARSVPPEERQATPSATFSQEPATVAEPASSVAGDGAAGPAQGEAAPGATPAAPAPVKKGRPEPSKGHYDDGLGSTAKDKDATRGATAGKGPAAGRDEAEPTTLAEAEAQLAAAQQTLARLYPSVRARSLELKESELELAQNEICRETCRAFDALKRAAAGVCRLDGSGERCQRANALVKEHAVRVSVCGCQ